MKVSILTFHDGINYGAFFQVYALRKFLQTHGYKSEVINYKSPGFTFREYKCFLNFLRSSPVTVIKNLIKIFKFKNAHRELGFTKRFFSRKTLAQEAFDRVVIGSDEVWNCNSSLIGYDPVYFSEGIKAKKIISYAASCGSVKSTDTIPVELQNALRRVERISVRDENSVSIMSQIGIEDAIKVLDPTFLVELSKRAIIPKERDFVLIYGFFSDEMICHIKEYVRFIGKKTIAVSYPCKWCDKSLETLGPFEWLGYFAICDRVITTMYHGALFSIQNSKEFCMYSTPYRENKVGGLFDELGIKDRFVNDSASLIDVFNHPLDYKFIKTRVEARVNESGEFLLATLGEW